MHMSAEPSPLHDMTQGIMYSMAATIVYPLAYAYMACKRVLGWYTVLYRSVI
jgi:hypothetical protein